MAKRIVGTSCEVLKKKNSLGSYKKHLKYKDITAKFDQSGNRKHVLALGNSELLCPTLSDFNKSGLADKFL